MLPGDTTAAAVGAMVGGFPIDVCNYIILQTGVFFLITSDIPVLNTTTIM